MSYQKVGVYLSEGQQNKLKNAYKNGEEVSLQIKKEMPANYTMNLTKTQIKHINDNKRITISKTQLKQNGGILPFLIPLLGALATGVASGAAGWGTKKALDKISGSGSKKKISGTQQNLEGKGTRLNWE